jgi:hypothetical protein
MAANYTCTSTAIPVIFGWEGEGVWALQMQEDADWVSDYNSTQSLFPSNFGTLSSFFFFFNKPRTMDGLMSCRIPAPDIEL